MVNLQFLINCIPTQTVDYVNEMNANLQRTRGRKKAQYSKNVHLR